MLVIHLEFDDAVVSKEEARLISEATRKIVSNVTKIDDVTVYGRSAEIKINAGPVEIFISMSAHLIPDTGALLQLLRKEFVAWKIESQFPHLINLSLIPTPWKFEIGI